MTTKEIITLSELIKHKNQWIWNTTLIGYVNITTMGNCHITQIEMRAIIQSLRANGEPIIASEKGYKYTTSILELKNYCKARRSEIDKELRILGAMELKQQERINKEIK